MARQVARKSKPRNPSVAPRPAVDPVARIVPLIVGTLAAAIGALASLTLAYGHIRGIELPGCGEGGPCDEAMNSVWGKLPILDWSVAYLGAAYFLAAVVVWITTRGGLPSAFRWLVRLGAAGSAFFCVIIVVERMYCPYCICSHIGNFAFWITMELTRRVRPRPLGPSFVKFAGVFIVATVALAIWDSSAAQKVEQTRDESAQAIIEASHRTTPPAQPETAPAVTEAPDEPPDGTDETPAAFTGRYRLGPELAAIRVVMITDYQCQDCRRLEGQLAKLMAERDDMSLSIKHFPFCMQCNPRVGKTLHENACWAARAAEAAGILWGDEGFFKLHEWLFENRGMFGTTEILEAGIREIGYDPAGFVEVVTSDETLKRVQADIEEASALGLFFTPMIFINGVEFKGWNAPDALSRTIAQVAATNPPPRTAGADRPPLAVAKYVEDWQAEPVRELAPDTHRRPLGAADADIEIVIWGDYQESGTAEADGLARAFVARQPGARYVFRHYPFNSDCNPNLPFQRHTLACWAARCAEAAGNLGGDDAYWRMHGWLMDNHAAFLEATAEELGVDADKLRAALYTMSADARQKGVGALGLDSDAVIATMQRRADEALAAAATEMGLDVAALRDGMEQPAVQAAILEDIAAGKRLPKLRHGTQPGLHGIPTIFVNGKYVPRWRLEGREVLSRVLDAAAGE